MSMTREEKAAYEAIEAARTRLLQLCEEAKKIIDSEDHKFYAGALYKPHDELAFLKRQANTRLEKATTKYKLEEIAEILEPIEEFIRKAQRLVKRSLATEAERLTRREHIETLFKIDGSESLKKERELTLEGILSRVSSRKDLKAITKNNELLSDAIEPSKKQAKKDRQKLLEEGLHIIQELKKYDMVLTLPRDLQNSLKEKNDLDQRNDSATETRKLVNILSLIQTAEETLSALCPFIEPYQHRNLDRELCDLISHREKGEAAFEKFASNLEATLEKAKTDRESKGIESLITQIRRIVEEKCALLEYHDPETVEYLTTKEVTPRIKPITENSNLSNQEKLEKLEIYCNEVLKKAQEKLRESVEKLRQIGLRHITTLNDTKMFVDITEQRAKELDRLCEIASNRDDLEKIKCCNTRLEALVKLALQQAIATTYELSNKREQVYKDKYDPEQNAAVTRVINDAIESIIENPETNHNDKITELNHYCNTVLSGTYGITATDSEQKASLIKKTADRQPTSPEFSDSEDEDLTRDLRKLRMQFDEEEKTSIEQARREREANYKEARSIISELSDNGISVQDWSAYLTSLDFFNECDKKVGSTDETRSYIDTVLSPDLKKLKQDNERFKKIKGMLSELKGLTSVTEEEYNQWEQRASIHRSEDRRKRFDAELEAAINQHIEKSSVALLKETRELFTEYLLLPELEALNEYTDETHRKQMELSKAEKNREFLKNVNEVSKSLFLKIFKIKHDELCEKMKSVSIPSAASEAMLDAAELLSAYSSPKTTRNRETEKILNEAIDHLNKIYETQKAKKEAEKKRPPLEHALFIATQRAKGLTETLEGTDENGPLHSQLKTTTESKPDEGMDANEFAQNKLQMLNDFIKFLEKTRVSSLKKTLLNEITELEKELEEIVYSEDYQHYFRTYFGTPEAISEFDRVAQEYVKKELDLRQNQFNEGSSAFEFTMKAMQRISKMTRDLVENQKAKLKSSLDDSINRRKQECLNVIYELHVTEGSEENQSKRIQELGLISNSVLTRKDLKKIEKHKSGLLDLLKLGKEKAEENRTANKYKGYDIINFLKRNQSMTKEEYNLHKKAIDRAYGIDSASSSDIHTRNYVHETLLPLQKRHNDKEHIKSLLGQLKFFGSKYDEFEKRAPQYTKELYTEHGRFISEINDEILKCKRSSREKDDGEEVKKTPAERFSAFEKQMHAEIERLRCVIVKLTCYNKDYAHYFLRFTPGIISALSTFNGKEDEITKKLTYIKNHCAKDDDQLSLGIKTVSENVQSLEQFVEDEKNKLEKKLNESIGKREQNCIEIINQLELIDGDAAKALERNKKLNAIRQGVSTREHLERIEAYTSSLKTLIKPAQRAAEKERIEKTAEEAALKEKEREEKSPAVVKLKEDFRAAIAEAKALTDELEPDQGGVMHSQLKFTIDAGQDENSLGILKQFIIFLKETHKLKSAPETEINEKPAKRVSDLKKKLLTEITQLQNELKEIVTSEDYSHHFYGKRQTPNKIISTFEKNSDRDKERLETLHKEFDKGQSTFDDTMANMQKALTAARDLVRAERNKLDTAKKEREKAALKQREERFLSLVAQKTPAPSINASLPSSSPSTLFGSTSKTKTTNRVPAEQTDREARRAVYNQGVKDDEAAKKAKAVKIVR